MDSPLRDDSPLRAQLAKKILQRHPSDAVVPFHLHSIHHDVTQTPTTAISTVDSEYLDFCYPKISLSEIRISSQLLGEGAFAQVFRGMFEDTPVAVKLFKHGAVDLEIQKTSFKREVQALTYIISLRNNPYVVQLVGAAVHPELIIVTELMQGSLYDLIHLDPLTLTDTEILMILMDVISGLIPVHSSGLIHRDITSKNILYNKHGEFFLADFGIARQNPSYDRAMYMSPVGQIRARAPEVSLRGKYNSKVDVYSVGILLWELVHQKKPWGNMPYSMIETQKNIGKKLHISRKCNPEFRRIMRWCWRTPSKRPSMEELLVELYNLKL